MCHINISDLSRLSNEKIAPEPRKSSSLLLLLISFILLYLNVEKLMYLKVKKIVNVF